MRPNLLILSGTTEATALARATAEAGLVGTASYAGRVDRPVPQPLPQRVGGFGGTAGLAEYIRQTGVTHLVDATHPFAAQMSANAVAASQLTGIPLVALTRPRWSPVAGDQWTHVPDIGGAVDALARPPCTIMLAVGRMHLDAFAPHPKHTYLLRFVDPPKAPPPFPKHHVVVDRGPFETAGDHALLVKHGIDLVVSKNSGGSAAYSKIEAARMLGLPVIMIDRPALPQRREMTSVQDVLDWIRHTGTERGV